MKSREEANLFLRNLFDGNMILPEKKVLQKIIFLIDKYKKRLSLDKKLLKKYEWVYFDEYMTKICINCGAPQEKGHKNWCELAKLLYSEVEEANAS